MSKYLLARYIWEVSTIHRARRITLKEINERWRDSPYYDGKDIPRRTWDYHRKEIEMFVGIPVDTLADSVHDSYYRMRRTAVDLNIPLLTNARLAEAFINAFLDVPLNELAIKEWSEYK